MKTVSEEEDEKKQFADFITYWLFYLNFPVNSTEEDTRTSLAQ